MAMSKDRVEFTLRPHYFGSANFEDVLVKAFNLKYPQVVFLRNRAREYPDQDIIILCRPSQFARFLIHRQEAGFQNMFKELNAKLIRPMPPVMQPYDVSGVQADI